MGYTLSDPALKLKWAITVGEKYRTYVFPGFDEITITGSLACCVDARGVSRIWDGTKGHMIPSSWIHMFFEVEEGGTVFTF